MSIKYIILHHTGGNYKPNEIDLKSYQLLIDGEGNSHKGTKKTSSTGGMNSITYNIAVCCHFGYKSPELQGNYPLTHIQFEAMCKKAAEACKCFNVPIKNVYTHYEIGQMCRSQEILKLTTWNKWLISNMSKIDLNYLNFKPDIKTDEVGDYIRNKINWYYKEL